MLGGWDGTDDTKSNVPVEVVGRVVVTVGRTTVPRIVVPGAAAFLGCLPPFLVNHSDGKSASIF